MTATKTGIVMLLLGTVGFWWNSRRLERTPQRGLAVGLVTVTTLALLAWGIILVGIGLVTEL